jgi:DNA repair exonuclease SbcCD ATPase subunit
MARVTAAKIKSFMGIDFAEFDTDSFTVIGGDNGQGKSSAVNAILWALAGRDGAVAQPVRVGADGCEVQVILLDGGLEVEITKKQKEGGSATLTVKRDGVTIQRPQEALSAMLGAIAFDPLDFAKMAPANQIETLLKAFKSDVDLVALDKAYSDLEAQRLDVGRDKKKADGHAASIVVPADAPDELVDITAAVNALQKAQADNAQHGRTTAAITETEAKIAALAEELAKARAYLTSLCGDLEMLTVVDVAPLNERVKNAEALNEGYRAKVAKANAEAEAARFDADWKAFDADMKANREQRAEAVRSLGVPIDGFGLDERGVTVNGVTSDGWSTAEAIKFGMAIFAAAERDLPLVWIKDGSLLDGKSRAVVEELAATHDVQVFIEVVGAEDGAIVFTDGRVS